MGITTRDITARNKITRTESCCHQGADYPINPSPHHLHSFVYSRCAQTKTDLKRKQRKRGAKSNRSRELHESKRRRAVEHRKKKWSQLGCRSHRYQPNLANKKKICSATKVPANERKDLALIRTGKSSAARENNQNTTRKLNELMYVQTPLPLPPQKKQRVSEPLQNKKSLPPAPRRESRVM